MQTHLTDREKETLDLITVETAITVGEMGRRLKVSPVTVRTTLNALAEKGFILRSRGGAFPTFHPQIMEHIRDHSEEKNRIAKAAAALIEDGDTVMIEAGTTTALIARYLFGKRDISIVTNNTLVLPYARANPSIRLTLIGGDFRPSTESMVGPIALQELERFHVAKAFVGTDGFSIEKGLTTHLVEGAEIVKKMASQAKETILIADAGKYGKIGFVQVLPLSSISRIIVDTGMTGEVLSLLEDLKIRIDRVQK